MIAWAIDPFSEDPKLNEKMGELISNLLESGMGENSVLPIAVLNQPLPQGILGNQDVVAEWETDLIQASEQKFSQLLKSLSHLLGRFSDKILPPLFIPYFSSSLREPAIEFCEVASKKGASLIVAGTSAKNAIDRLFLGSFGETLILSSKVPLLTVNPGTKLPGKIANLLFPTDFSDESKKSLKKMIEIAKALSGRILIQHKMTVPADVVFEPGLALAPSGIANTEDLFRSEKEAKEKLGKQWCDLVRSEGVDCDLQILFSPASLAHSLIEGADNFDKQNGNGAGQSIFVTAMQKHSGLSRVLGHVSRTLAREAKVPVLILPAPE